jgi:hypothetical protein
VAASGRNGRKEWLVGIGIPPVLGRCFQHQTLEAPGLGVPIPEILKTPSGQLCAECLATSRLLPRVVGKLGPGLEQRCRHLPLEGVPRLGIACLGKPLPHQILVLEIAFGRPDDAFRPHQAACLPVEAAIDHPAQDAGPFALKFFPELLVDVGRRAGEGDEVEAPAGGLVHIPQQRLVVADDGQLEVGPEGEEVLLHEPRGDGIAARQLLDPAFGP